MKIVYVSSPLISNVYGGGEKFLEGLVDSLPENEHIFLGNNDSLRSIFKDRGYKTYKTFFGYEPVTPKNLLLIPVSFFIALVNFFRFRKLFKEADLVVTALSFSEPIFLAPFIHFFTKTPIVSCVRNNRCPKIYRTPLVFVLRYIWNQHVSVFISKSQIAEFADKGMTGKKSTYIINAIPTYKFKPKKTAEKALKLGFLARLNHEKGLDVLLKALSHVDFGGQKVEVLIGGEGEEMETCKKIAKDLNLSKKVRLNWQGFVSDNKGFYKDIDLFIFPSRRESFGKTLIEAWESGVPVLSSDITVFKEIKGYSDDLEKKLMFESENDKDLANKIEYFLKNKKLYQDPQRQEYLHDIVVKNFDAENYFNSYKKLFKKITNKK